MKHWFWGPARNSHVQFFRYFFVGGSSTVVHLSIFYVLVNLLHIHYLVANVGAFCVAFFWNYFLGIWWIFKRGRLSRRHELLFTGGIAIIGLILNSLILSFCVEVLKINPNIAIYIATAIVLFWNFGARKKFVFH